ncbi:hypothetical protein FA13DRAFT_1715501 [Coprinellus micaceus]|uniref:Uncharacterized protein n=1 Tax=Coprinellus micaceus TaxID=71717 RepID=A0A4Y7SN05_COPMI|nr:hypothetical protein FA13DRAFT_1715501 [Coprinellus micaceus]
MAAPTQEYPPWLSPSAVVSTNAAGEVVTSTTVVYLPLTYIGPSIPLNSLYTYGGSTYPPTIVTGFITTTPTPTTSPTSPTTTSAIPTTTVTTTSDTTSTAPPTTPSTSTSTSSSSTSSTTTEPSSVGSLSRGQLVGVIVASILGLIFLFVFLLAFWLWCKGRRNRRRSGEFSTITPLEEDYFIVGEDGGRTPGEGSPRQSGEEGDSFLRRPGPLPPGSPSRGSPGMMEVPTDSMGTRRPSVTRVPVPNTASMSSSGSSSTNTSGYGVLLDRPTLGILPPTAEEDHPFTGGGYALSDDEMREINRESVLPQEEQEPDYTGAYAISRDPELAPPRLVDPDNAFSRPDIPHPQLPPPTQQNRFSAQSNPSIVDAEDAALLTARRVNVSDLPASPFQRRRDACGYSKRIPGWFNSGESLGNTGRYSPHLTPEPQRRSRRYSPTFSPVPMTDEDVESGRAAMAQRPMTGPDIDSFGRGLDLSGQRPISGVSARSGTSGSGQTVYHDARSSMPGTPAAPRVTTPLDFGAELALPEHAWLAGAIAGPAPPPYQDDDPFIDNTGAVPRMDIPQPIPSTTDVDDILDMPAPSALSHFQSSSTQFQSNTTSSDRDSATVSSIGLSRNPFPPGLDFMAHAKEVSGGMTWTPDGSLSAATSGTHEDINNDAPTVDILEEEPPEARDTWRSINSGAGAGGVSELGRRTTFGQCARPALPQRLSRSDPHRTVLDVLGPSIRPSTQGPSVPQAPATGQKPLPPAQSPVSLSGAEASFLIAEAGGMIRVLAEALLPLACRPSRPSDRAGLRPLLGLRCPKSPMLQLITVAKPFSRMETSRPSMVPRIVPISVRARARSER